MNPSRKAVESQAERGPVNGLYTPEMVDGMEPARIAALLNTLVSRVNVDADTTARRKAIVAAFTLIVFGALIGSSITYVAVSLWLNPVRDLLQHLPIK